jgi:hypothetical protein
MGMNSIILVMVKLYTTTCFIKELFISSVSSSLEKRVTFKKKELGSKIASFFFEFGVLKARFKIVAGIGISLRLESEDITLTK